MQPYSFGHRHLLGIEGLSREDIEHVLDLRRHLCRAEPAGREEDRHLARAHADQLLFREFDAHPHLVRGRRQTARRRCHQHGGRGLVDAQGRDADRHGDDPERDAPRRAGRAPSRIGRGAAAVGKGRLRRHQRRRRQPRAPDAGPARRADDPPAQGAARRADGRDLRRRPAQPGGALEHRAAQCDGRARPGRRAAHLVAGARSSGSGSRCFTT